MSCFCRSALLRAFAARTLALSSAAWVRIRVVTRFCVASSSVDCACVSLACAEANFACAERTLSCSSVGSSWQSSSPFFTAWLMSNGSFVISPLARHLISTSRLAAIVPLDAIAFSTLARLAATMVTALAFASAIVAVTVMPPSPTPASQRANQDEKHPQANTARFLLFRGWRGTRWRRGRCRCLDGVSIMEHRGYCCARCSISSRKTCWNEYFLSSRCSRSCVKAGG